MKMTFIAALAAIGDILGTVLAYALAAATAGGVLLLFAMLAGLSEAEKKNKGENENE